MLKMFFLQQVVLFGFKVFDGLQDEPKIVRKKLTFRRYPVEKKITVKTASLFHDNFINCLKHNWFYDNLRRIPRRRGTFSCLYHFSTYYYSLFCTSFNAIYRDTTVYLLFAFFPNNSDAVF